MADHARQHQPALGDHPLFLEVPAVELRIGEDRLACDLVEGDVLRRQLGCRGNRQAVTDALGIADGPLHGLHAAEAAADHRGPLRDAEDIRQARLAMDPVFHGHHREIRAKRLAGGGVEAGGSGRAVAAAQVVQADDEELAGVDGLAGADATVPPAGLAFVRAVVAGRMMVAGQRVADQHGIAARGVQLAVGLVDQLVVGQAAPAGKCQGFGEVQHLGRHQANRVLGKGSRHRPCS
ncbi:hypothetical protein D9M68_761370 [compost metagenome]